MKQDGKHFHREEQKKLTIMFKIVNNEVSGYLKYLLPNSVGDQTHYQSRNNQNYEVRIIGLYSMFKSTFSFNFKTME